MLLFTLAFRLALDTLLEVRDGVVRDVFCLAFLLALAVWFAVDAVTFLVLELLVVVLVTGRLALELFEALLTVLRAFVAVPLLTGREALLFTDALLPLRFAATSRFAERAAVVLEVALRRATGS